MLLYDLPILALENTVLVKVCNINEFPLHSIDVSVLFDAFLWISFEIPSTYPSTDPPSNQYDLHNDPPAPRVVNT